MWFIINTADKLLWYPDGGLLFCHFHWYNNNLSRYAHRTFLALRAKKNEAKNTYVVCIGQLLKQRHRKIVNKEQCVAQFVILLAKRFLLIMWYLNTLAMQKYKANFATSLFLKRSKNCLLITHFNLNKHAYAIMHTGTNKNLNLIRNSWWQQRDRIIT